MAAAEALVATETCFHCGLDVPIGSDFAVELQGAPRAMCCVGCQAVAEMLRDEGLERWYVEREQPTGVPAQIVPEVLEEADFLRLEGEDRSFETHVEGDRVEVALLVEGMTCPACAWVIERALSALPAIEEARVNLIARRVRVVWRAGEAALDDVVARLAAVGFRARPDAPGEGAALHASERRAALIRLGIAGLATMNVMTYAVALYFGAIAEMAEGIDRFLQWMCWLVATPVVLVSARPHFEGAWRDLRARRPGMDVPIALAIGGAYVASAVAVMRGEGEVYFESVCMFTFFIGLGRYLEHGVRQRADALSDRLVDASPALARRIVEDAQGAERAREEVVPANRLAVGDRIVVRPGDSIPVDGIVRSGAGAVEEAVLSGEPWPRRVACGDEVRAGSVNADALLEIEVTRVEEESTLGVLHRLIDRAQSDKPAIARRADRLGGVFVAAVLVIAAVTAIAWSLIDPSRVFDVTLAVLVATCPCALGLATPTALAAASEGLARIGFVLTGGSALESLARVDRVVFDKTGSLTEGRPRIETVELVRDLSNQDAFARARALEAGSTHVLARAFTEPGAVTSRFSGGSSAGPGVLPVVEANRSIAGAGVEGTIAGVRHRLGRPDWASALAAEAAPPVLPETDAHTWILLADEDGAIAWFGLGDALRAEAAASVDELRSLGVELEILTGDPSSAASRIAAELGGLAVTSGVMPEGKVDHIRRHQTQGERVAFVGDGLNDGPVLRAADVSVAMAGGCDLSLLSADALLYRDDLAAMPRAVRWARRTRRIVTQNFAWAIGYNLLVLPLAVTGNLAPWLAAAGMSASSLLVALNATRLRREERRA
ncbi:MAG: heavy metal translocating P-type ATPase [bacterium]|nr:heavy metal translocating P-type ATPase [bacterium]